LYLLKEVKQIKTTLYDTKNILLQQKTVVFNISLAPKNLILEAL